MTIFEYIRLSSEDDDLKEAMRNLPGLTLLSSVTIAGAAKVLGDRL